LNRRRGKGKWPGKEGGISQYAGEIKRLTQKKEEEIGKLKLKKRNVRIRRQKIWLKEKQKKFQPAIS